MSVSNNAINNTVGASISGVTNTLTVTNPSNTASSQARVNVTVGGGTAGDPFTLYTVSGVTNWAQGIDNSDSDVYVLSASTAPGTTNVMRATTAGEINYPLQPAFLTFLDGDIANVTGDATNYTIVFNSEVFDQGGDLSGATFTAPVTGKYYLAAGAKLETVGVGHTQAFLSLVTSNREYRDPQLNGTACATGSGDLGMTISSLCDMDAADTATVAVTVSGGAKTVGIGGAAVLITFFSGNLTA